MLKMFISVNTQLQIDKQEALALAMVLDCMNIIESDEPEEAKSNARYMVQLCCSGDVDYDWTQVETWSEYLFQNDFFVDEFPLTKQAWFELVA
jgi:hypothetical protein